MSAAPAATSAQPVPPGFTLSPGAAWAIFGAMAFGNFMAILDIQIVASSLNEIQAGLGATQAEVAWVQTSYLIAEVIAIPLSGFLSRLFSTRVYFTMCALLFSLSSLLCGLAWDINSMLIFRAIQGFVGGGMIPTTMAALFVLFPPSKQTLPMVVVGMVSTLGPAIGPSIGGWLTNQFSWHWMFFINLAPGLMIAALVFAGRDIDHAEKGLFHRIDWLGLVSMALFLGCLEFVVDEGPRNDWFADDHILYASVVMVISAAIFFRRSFTSPNPIVDLRVFANRTFSILSLMTFAMGMALFGMVYILPVFLGQVRGMNSVQIGHIMMIQGGTMFLVAPIIAALLPRMDGRILIVVGMLLTALGIYEDSHLTLQSDFDELFWAQVIRGAGLMICLITMSQLALSRLPLHQIKSASGVYNLTRNMGGAIGLAIVNTLLDRQTALHVNAYNARITPDNPAAMQWLEQTAAQIGGENGMTLATARLSRQIHLQGLTSAFNDILLGLSILLVLVCCLIVFVPKPPIISKEAAAAAH